MIKKPSFQCNFAHLKTSFYSKISPSPVKSPSLIKVNNTLANFLQISPEWLNSEEGLSVLSGNLVLANSTPVAAVYAGHQFGQWNPQLGDGRAVLLGEVTAQDGQLYDIQLKGSGVTPYSRRGDGRSPLGPVLREYIVSEAMAQLNIPTTRSLMAVATGEAVQREKILPGAILTRVAKSHIRIGSFQFFAAQKESQALKELADFVIVRHYPDLKKSPDPYLALFQAILERQAQLIAQWQLVGFIHGVMNTDNMLVSGETIDYGPCAFMDAYDVEACFSSIDYYGRYKYSSQPEIALWNLSCLAQTFVPLLNDSDELSLNKLHEALDSFNEHYDYHYFFGLHQKLGLAEMTEQSHRLIEELLALMAEHKTDFSLTFRHLTDVLAEICMIENHQAVAYRLPSAFSVWIVQWQAFIKAQNLSAEHAYKTMISVNPAFIPRNHLIEEAIVEATEHNNYQPFHQLVSVLSNPYQFSVENSRYAQAPNTEQLVLHTFCGT